MDGTCMAFSPMSYFGRASARTMVRNCAPENLDPSFPDSPTRTCASELHSLARVPRNDVGEGASVRAHPIAVETVGHAVAEMDQRGGSALDVLCVEYGKIAAVLPRPPDHREQPAVTFRSILAAL